MPAIFCKRCLGQTGWQHDVRIVHADGLINTVEAESSPKQDDTRVDTMLPAPGNLHSHCFQRAMAGMTEHRGPSPDSFWTWRRLMYRFMDLITPEQYQAIAAQVFVEMQEAGYASVGEFHYVHHQLGGQPYTNRSELSDRVFAAAQETGIGLTHLPVLYSYGGAGEAPLKDGQLRFGNTLAEFEALLTNIQSVARDVMPFDTVVGVAPHSLRATRPDDLMVMRDLGQGGPIHMHIAEQPKEVSDVQAWLGQTPVAWLLDHCDVTAQWCLIHATHMTKDETVGLARSGAVAGLCPITEANLGDGIFNGQLFMSEGGAFGVGSDSNIRISLNEELRTLEYSQRTRDLARNVMTPGVGSVGQYLFTAATTGSAQALGRNAGRIEPGRFADFVAIDSSNIALMALEPEQLLDGWCFAAGPNAVTDVWSAGRHCVKEGRHVQKTKIEAAYRKALDQLMEHL